MRYFFPRGPRGSESEWVSMSEDVVMTAVIILGSMIAGWVLAGLVLWMGAEWEERKWRKRLGEIQREGLDRV